MSIRAGLQLPAWIAPRQPPGPGWSANDRLSVSLDAPALPQTPKDREVLNEGTPGAGGVRILAQTHRQANVDEKWPRAHFVAAVSQLGILRELQRCVPRTIYIEGAEAAITWAVIGKLREELREAVHHDSSGTQFMHLVATRGAEVHAALQPPNSVELPQTEPPDRRRRNIEAYKRSITAGAEIVFNERETYVLTEALRAAKADTAQDVFVIYGMGHDFSRRLGGALEATQSEARVVWENFSGFPQAEIEAQRLVADEFRRGKQQRKRFHDFGSSDAWRAILHDPYVAQVLAQAAEL